MSRSRQPPLQFGIFLQDNARKSIVAGPVVPKHIQQVFPPIIVMKERRIEAAAVQIDWIGPLAIDRRTGDEVIMKIAQRGSGRSSGSGAPVTLHIRVD